MSYETPENNANSEVDKASIQSESIPFIQNEHEAIDFIEQRFEQGERPIVTVKKEYAEALSQGLTPHASWDYNEDDLIAGTFCRDPYEPANETEERIKVRVTNISVEQIKPRFTGPKNAFHGVVSLIGPIPPEALEITA